MRLGAERFGFRDGSTGKLNETQGCYHFRLIYSIGKALERRRRFNAGMQAVVVGDEKLEAKSHGSGISLGGGLRWHPMSPSFQTRKWHVHKA